MSTYTKIKTLPLSLFNNAEYLSFMNHVLDLANGNSGGGDSESPDEISLLTGSDGIPELGLTKEFLETYEADLLAMADVVDESRISQETEQMTLHDTNRDNLAIYIITRISRAGTLPLEAERDAGKYLYKIIKPYNGIARLPMAQETAKIKGLLLDLRKDENKPLQPPRRLQAGGQRQETPVHQLLQLVRAARHRHEGGAVPHHGDSQRPLGGTAARQPHRRGLFRRRKF